MDTMQRDPRIERKLRGVWRRQRLHTHVRGGAWVVATAILIILAIFLVDWLFLMPFVGRRALLAVGVLAIGHVLLRHWAPGLLRFSRMEAAARIERACPELLSLLLSYVELAGDRVVHGAKELKRVVFDQAVDEIHSRSFHAIVDFSDLWPLVRRTLGVVIVFVLVGVAFPDHLTAFAHRMMGSEEAYPTKTRIVGVAGSFIVKKGDPLTLATRAAGRVPLTAQLYMRRADGEWQFTEILRTGAGLFEYVSAHASSTFDYYLEIGDAHTAIHRVTVVPPPGMVRAQAVVRAPDYTRIPAYTVQGLNLDVPEGAQIDWEIDCDTPVVAADLVFDDGTTVPMEMTPLSGEAGARMRIAASRRMDAAATYHIRWTREDTGFEYVDSTHRVYVKPDRPPQATILQPQGDIKATVNKVLSLKLKANDDYGVESAALVYMINDGAETRVDLGAPPRVANASAADSSPRYGIWPVTWMIREDIAHLAAGDKVTYLIEVVDTRGKPSAGEIRRSQRREIEIVSRSEYQQYIFAQLAQVREYLAAIHTEARKSRQAVKALVAGEEE